MKHLNIAVARIWHEAHSFTPTLTGLDDFRRKEWNVGASAAEFYRGTNTEIGAVVDMMDSEPGLSVHFSLCTAAPPGGLVPQADMDVLHDAVVDGLRGRRWDGLYLSLHGATLSTEALSPDTDLLRRIRGLAGKDVPIAVSFDMHACIDPELANLVQILAGYRTYPHVDMRATGARAMRMLVDTLRTGEGMKLHLRPVAMLPLSHMMRTDQGPMAELVELAKEAETTPGVKDATLFASFTYADSPNSSAMVAITTAVNHDPRVALDRLEKEFLSRRERFTASFIDPIEGLKRAEAILAAGDARGPVALVDTADNPLSGGIGDTTGLLRAWLDSGSRRRTLFCFFHDPDLVARCHELGEGVELEAELGGRIVPAYGAPVRLKARVLRLTDGRFRNRGPMEHGVQVDIGRTVLLESGPLQLVVGETCQSANDPAWCDLHRIDLDRTELFLIKAKNHFRAGFADICRAIVDVEAPGPAPADLSQIPFRHVPPHLLAGLTLGDGRKPATDVS